MRPPFAALLSLAVIAAAPVAARDEAKLYTFDVKVFEGKKLLIEPRLVIGGSEPAVVERSNQQLYLKLVARPLSPGRFEINSSMVQWTAQGLRSDSSNLDVVADGATGITTLRPRGASDEAMRIEVRIVTNRT